MHGERAVLTQAGLYRLRASGTPGLPACDLSTIVVVWAETGGCMSDTAHDIIKRRPVMLRAIFACPNAMSGIIPHRVPSKLVIWIPRKVNRLHEPLSSDAIAIRWIEFWYRWAQPGCSQHARF